MILPRNLRELESMLPDGFRIEHGGAHPRIVKPDGEPLRDRAGRPVTVAATPRRDWRNDVAKIRRVLEGRA